MHMHVAVKQCVLMCVLTHRVCNDEGVTLQTPSLYDMPEHYTNTICSHQHNVYFLNNPHIIFSQLLY